MKLHILCLVVFIGGSISVPGNLRADFEIFPYLGATIGGQTIIEDVIPDDVHPMIQGDDLTIPTQTWNLSFITEDPPVEPIPLHRSVYVLYRVDSENFNIEGGVPIRDVNYSLIYAPIPEGDNDPDIETSTVTFSLPPLGDPGVTSSYYVLRVAALPIEKEVYDPITDSYQVYPYTEADYLEYLFADYDAEEPPITHGPEWGVGLWFEYIQKSPTTNHIPEISNLGQFKKFGVESIPEGASLVSNEAVFKATLTDSDNDTVRLEVEVVKSDESFDGEGTILSDPVSPDGIASVAVTELIPPEAQYTPGGNVASFKWRARVIDSEGASSEWQEFGGGGSEDLIARVVPLWTQVESAFPSVEESRAWAPRAYASGVDFQCGNRETGTVTIAQCGCAITSLVMVADYFGIDSSIENTSVNPLTLNNWLITNKGYTSGNALNWIKGEEFLGFIEDGKKKKILALDTANFKTTNRSVVDGYLANQNPVIAFSGAKGHYLVLTDTVLRSTTPTYLVRDPRWYRTATLDDVKNTPNEVQAYGNTFTHATIFTKLTTPKVIASSGAFFLASPAELLITDSFGRRAGKDPATGIEYAEIPGARYVTEDAIRSSDEDSDSGHVVKALYLPELLDSNYTLAVIGTGNGLYTLSSQIYGANGTSTEETFVATTSTNKRDVYQVTTTTQGNVDVLPLRTISVITGEFTSLIKSSPLRPLQKLTYIGGIELFEYWVKKERFILAKSQLQLLEAQITKDRRVLGGILEAQLRSLIAELKTKLP